MSLIMKKDEYPTIIDLYNNGMRQVDIAKRYGVDQSTISYILRKCGISGVSRKSRKIQENEYAKIIELYKSGLLQKEIASMYNVGQCCISSILIKCGIEPRTRINKQKEEAVVYAYKSGMSQSQIEKDLHITHKSIEIILNKHNVSKRSLSEANRTYNFDEHYFDVIDTPNKAYFLGMLYSDGCNGRNNAIKIKLQEDDYDILDKLNQEIRNERPLRYYAGQHGAKGTWELCFGSTHISSRLYELGCVHAKSLILKYPTWLDLSLQSHFLRGYMDGDGSINKNPKKMQVSLVGTHSFCLEASRLIQEVCRCHCYIYIHSEHEECDATSSLRLNHKSDACTFLDYIYKDAELYMQRKYDIYKSIYCNNT